MKEITIADIILGQLGGNKFIAMTGANYLTEGEDFLFFKIGKNSGGIGGVKIILTPADLYTIEFYHHVNKKTYHVKTDTVDDVYAEDLQGIFEDKTGLRTRL